MSMLLLLGIPVVLILLLVVNGLKNSEEQVAPGRYRTLDLETQPRLIAGTRPTALEVAVRQCRRCADEFDPDLYPDDAECRRQAAEFWLRHELCKPIPADNKPHRQGAPDS